jgi:hypothetical protein
MIKRAAVPILLVLAAVSLLVYGAAFNRHQVIAEEEFTPPPPPPLPPFINQPPRPGQPRDPFGAPPPFMNQPPRPPSKPEKVERTILERESKLVLEATRGGVERMEDGRIWRTYMGAPPSGCPT